MRASRQPCGWLARQEHAFAEKVEPGAAILIRLTLPSTGPELCGWLSPAVTAARSLVKPVANRAIGDGVES